MINVNREPVEVDVLVVGGGIAGLMAAINAGSLDAKVIVAERPIRNGVVAVQQEMTTSSATFLRSMETTWGPS